MNGHCAFEQMNRSPSFWEYVTKIVQKAPPVALLLWKRYNNNQSVQVSELTSELVKFHLFNEEEALSDAVYLNRCVEDERTRYRRLANRNFELERRLRMNAEVARQHVCVADVVPRCPTPPLQRIIEENEDGLGAPLLDNPAVAENHRQIPTAASNAAEKTFNQNQNQELPIVPLPTVPVSEVQNSGEIINLFAMIPDDIFNLPPSVQLLDPFEIFAQEPQTFSALPDPATAQADIIDPEANQRVSTSQSVGTGDISILNDLEGPNTTNSVANADAEQPSDTSQNLLDQEQQSAADLNAADVNPADETMSTLLSGILPDDMSDVDLGDMESTVMGEIEKTSLESEESLTNMEGLELKETEENKQVCKKKEEDLKEVKMTVRKKPRNQKNTATKTVPKQVKKTICKKKETPVSSKKGTHTCSEAGCGMKFASKQNLYQHKKRIHRDKDKRCEVCGKMFALKSALTRHGLIHKNEDKK